MESLVDFAEPSKIIDVACGSGRWLMHLQKAGVNVFGVDVCEEMLVRASQHCSLWGRLALGDVECLPIQSETADCVLCSMALGYFRNIKKAFREFARIAAPGTTIAISDLHPASILAGWTRSFRAGGKVYEIDHQGHSVAGIDDAAHGAGLLNLFKHTAYLGQPELAIFQRNRKATLFSEVSQTPALYLHAWQKPC
jgi:ubiquinone/menaquinone biosynthesis C-methylase UbiE